MSSTLMLQPSFNHPEILNLYLHGTKIPEDILQQIIALPKESVIADLEKILLDAIDRYDYFSNEDWDDNRNNFALHAICLLAELDAKESFPKILAFLESNEDIVDYWLNEHLFVTLWHPIYRLGQNHLELIKSFLINRNITVFAKTSVSAALVQMVLQIPEKRNEIIEIYREILEYYKNHPVERDSEEAEFLTCIVEDTAKSGLSELKPLIEKLYNKRFVSLNELPLSLYLNLLKDNDHFFTKEDVLDIYHLYAEINTDWENFNDDDDVDNGIEDNYEILKTPLSHRALNLELPVFNHKVVEELFEYNMTISRDTLKTILDFPREEIIPDLIKVINFAIENSSVYYDSELSDRNGTSTAFVLHAMYILAELHEEKALDIIIKFLSIEEDYLDYWLGDFLTEEIWKILLLTGYNRLHDLVKIATNYQINESVRFAASQAIAQMVLHYPDKRNEVISSFQDILNFYINNDNPDDDAADEILGAVICDLADINATELLSSVKVCFDQKKVDLSWTGTFKEIEKGFINKTQNKYPIEDIFKSYDTIVTKWYSYTSDDDEFDDENFSDDDNNYNTNNIISSGEQFVRENPKTGRNDPCPCGSGKKYKKCCLNTEK